MSRNGSGQYSLPAGNPVVTNTIIASTWANTTLSDIASALTQSVANDGQTQMVGDLPMGGNKITGMASGSMPTDGVNYSQLTSAITNLQSQVDVVKGGVLGTVWTNVTSSRSTGTNFTNNSSKTIGVLVVVGSQSNGAVAQINNNVVWREWYDVNTGAGQIGYGTAFLLVPVGSTYQVTGGPLQSWWELL